MLLNLYTSTSVTMRCEMQASSGRLESSGWGNTCCRLQHALLSTCLQQRWWSEICQKWGNSPITAHMHGLRQTVFTSVAATHDWILAFPETAPCSLEPGFPRLHPEQHSTGTQEKAENYKQTPRLESVKHNIKHKCVYAVKPLTLSLWQINTSVYKHLRCSKRPKTVFWCLCC